MGTLQTEINNQHKSSQVKSWFLRRGETGENLSVQRTNKLNPHTTPDPEIEPGPHRWEASALTTTPSPHPLDKIFFPNVREMFITLGVLPIGSIAIFLLLSEKAHMPSKFNSSLNYFDSFNSPPPLPHEKKILDPPLNSLSLPQLSSQ